MSTCSLCKRDKIDELFYYRKDRGTRSKHCISCHTRMVRRNYKHKRESINKKRRERYARNPKVYSETRERYRNSVRGISRSAVVSRWYGLLRLYGITRVEFNARLESQNGKCAVCGLVFNLSHFYQKPCVDHDHISGVVRGLLCRKCNSGIGLLQDNPAIVQAAADYLRVHSDP